MMASDDNLPAPLPPDSIPPPPPPRAITTEGIEPQASLINRGADSLQSPADELGRREYEEVGDDEVGGRNDEDEDGDRDALANARYGDAGGDPYAQLGDAFTGGGSKTGTSRNDDDLIGF